MTIIPATHKEEIGGTWSEDSPGKRLVSIYLKNKLKPMAPENRQK
jgi:hypothetical protein